MSRLLALVVLLGLCTTSAHLFAQSDVASITGRITTNEGLPLDQAHVRAMNLAGGLTSEVFSNGHGIYSLRNLRPGEYRLIVEKQGFRQIVLTGLTLSVQDSLSRNFTMEIGSVIQSISMGAGVQQINVAPAVSTMVNQQFIQNTPLNGRNFQGLLYLIPGTVVASIQYSPAQFSVNGLSPNANYVTVDGVSGYSAAIPSVSLDHAVGRTLTGLTINGGKGSIISLDAMQEFRVQTSSYAPEYGRTPGGQVSIVTKSGTNQFHGILSDYMRNEVFDARNYFDPDPLPKPQLRQNDFGAAVGGPLVGSSTFFFFSYEGLRLLLPQTATGTFYTASARQNVAAAYAPLLQALPLPEGPVNSDGITASLTSAYSNPSNLDTFNLRVDYILGQRNRVFVRYNHAPLDQWNRYWSENDNFTATTDMITAGWATSFDENKTNNLTANLSRAESNLVATMDNYDGAVAPPDSALFPTDPVIKTRQFVMTLGTGMDGELRTGPILQNVQRIFNAIDAFSISTGAHELKFGFDFRQLNPTNGAPEYSLGVTPGSYANLQSGTTSSVSTQSNITLTTRSDNYSLFAQDTWQTSPRLTLTYGLRWEVNPPPVSTIESYPLYPVTGIFDAGVFGLGPAGSSLWQTEFSNFAPRIGAAYRLKPDAVLRGAFGLFYDLPYASGPAGALTVFPYARSKVVAGTVPFDFSNAAFVPPAFTTVPNSSDSKLAAVDPNLSLPLVYEWNVAFELALGANQSLSATYVGAHGERLLRQDTIQLSPSGFPVVAAIHNAGWSQYNALQVQFQHRMTNRWQALVSYTLANTRDTGSGSQCPCGATSSIKHVNVSADYGISDFDVRNGVAAAFSYRVPLPHRGEAANAILRNWQFDGIVRTSSSPPYNPIAPALSNVFGPYYTRPDVVPGKPYYLAAPGQPGDRRLNLAAFSVPANGSQGNLPRNYFRAFPIYQTDLALSWQANIKERLNFNLRMEYFNIFNHPMFSPYENIYIGSPNFGAITQTLNESLSGLNPLYQIGGPRSGQLTLKLQF